MANEITESKCLEAELLLGYKYFQQKNALAAKKAEYTARLQSANNAYARACDAYDVQRQSDLASESYFEKRYPQDKAAYQAYCEDLKAQARARELQATAERLAAQKAEKEQAEKERQVRFWVWFLIGIALIVLTVVMSIEGCKGAETPADASPLASLAVFVGVGAFLCMGTAFGGFDKAEEENAQNTQTEQAQMQGFMSTSVNLPSYRTYLIEKNGYAYYLQDYPAKGEEYVRRENELSAQVQEMQAQLTKTEQMQAELETRGENILKKLNVIPVYYFTEDALSKMLFFYVNKRADTVKELINLYEQTEFEDSLLKAVRNISISVDKLKDSVNGEFIRLGAQLGILGQSVAENSEMQRLNREKLKEIQDKNEKYYFDIIDEMHSLEFESEIKIS